MLDSGDRQRARNVRIKMSQSRLRPTCIRHYNIPGTYSRKRSLCKQFLSVSPIAQLGKFHAAPVQSAFAAGS